MDARPGTPALPASRAARRFWWWTGAGGALALAILFQFDPASHAFYPRCGLRALTGWECPGCGGLRALHQLLHGHFGAAFALNPLVVLLPMVGAAALGWRAARWPVPAWVRRHWPAALVAALMVFALARNLPRIESLVLNP